MKIYIYTYTNAGLKQKRAEFYSALLLVKMLVQLSLHLYFHILFKFQQYWNIRAEISAYFLWLTYCKLQVESSPRLKVMKGAVAAETAVERPLIERFANERTVI